MPLKSPCLVHVPRRLSEYGNVLVCKLSLHINAHIYFSACFIPSSVYAGELGALSRSLWFEILQSPVFRLEA
jgi:hypothetical protein